jgi:hypothetical protein
MILWSSRKLEHALAGGQLSSWSKVKYLMLPSILGSMSLPFYIVQPRYGAEESMLVETILSILAAFLTYWGIKQCFHANQQIDDKYFFERFAVLFVPPFVRATAAVLLIGIVWVSIGLPLKVCSIVRF